MLFAGLESIYVYSYLSAKCENLHCIPFLIINQITPGPDMSYDGAGRIGMSKAIVVIYIAFQAGFQPNGARGRIISNENPTILFLGNLEFGISNKSLDTGNR